ncbi:MAG: HEAT repeat domain-containing protein [Verrucomicrobiia bacterium]
MRQPPARFVAAVLTAMVAVGAATVGGPSSSSPYDRQVAEHVAKLNDASPHVRLRAAESLGFLRAYRAEAALVARLKDDAAEVRRQAAMSLSWCGGRAVVAPLLEKLDDIDWLTRQAAHVALTNLTGMEFPFNALAPDAERQRQAQAWRDWWKKVPADQPPPEVLALLAGPKVNVPQWTLTASSVYRGPLEVLIDGDLEPGYWQTKNVKPPQWCQLDLGAPTEVRQVTVHQYAAGYCMTDYEVSTSLDGRKFERAVRSKEKSPVALVVNFPPRKARFVRITSFVSERKLYPTTFREIEINGQRAKPVDTALAWPRERGVRALGALGGKDATAAIIAMLGPSPATTPALRPMVRAGIRAVGRLREDAGRDWLISLLENPMWARCAAEALGDVGDRRAVGPLLTAYARFAKGLDEKYPAEVPADDNMKFPSEDRMLETPYWIAHALCRLPLDDPRDRARLRELAPLIMANLQGDHDTFMLYQPEAGHLLTRYLLEAAGMRQEAAEQAFAKLGQPRRAANPEPAYVWAKFDVRRISPWLPCVCTEREDLTRLLPLLQHTNGWVRINAAKTIGWLGDSRAIAPLAETLATAKSEGDYGWSKIWKEEEFNDPCPRWREALLRALGLLKATQHVTLIAKVLDDEGSVLEVRHAAAEALADIGNGEALAVLRRTATTHPFGTVRQVARDALLARGIEPEAARTEIAAGRPASRSDVATGQPCIFDAKFNALLFVKGDNDLPNTPQTVEQADRWRQTYAVTDEGPSYRPGDNFFVLSPPRPDGKVTQLTHFKDGWVGEPELSWDAKQVIFTRREKDSLWWHVWRMNIDGTGLQQLTHGPYHHVGPAFLPDGRIVCASTRTGIRDEYHGYSCTALYVMNPDGSDLHPIATNIGRDNEPALLPDGRLVFSRLEVFYSRNKTELTLHAAFPDGTHDVVLYGPERRKFWRELDHGVKGPDDGQEAPLTHRVLRVTQPQPMPDGRIVVSTQGGLTLIGPRRDTEQLISPDYKTRAYTTPVALSDGTLLCATTLKTQDRKKVDLGLYRLDPRTGKLDLIYNDPAAADYEPRPIIPRQPPPVRADSVSRDAYSGRFLCASVFNSQEKEVAQRGRFVRLIEGVPVVGRHETHTGGQPVWKNHGGTFARVLGTAPLAPDGSFYVELPADRLVHLQVLDSDRRVINNQLTWIYTRPGETKSCVGCHEDPHTTTEPRQPPLALQGGPLSFLPAGGEFSYRAKAWFKGSLPSEIEERTRTVHAVNLLAR